MVRLKVVSSAPVALATPFQFLMVRLKDDSTTNRIIRYSFQFLMVRLKVTRGTGIKIILTNFNSLWFD